MKIPAVSDRVLDAKPIPLPTFLTMPGVESPGVHRLKEMFARNPFAGTDQEFQSVLHATAGMAVVATIEALAMRGMVFIPSYSKGDLHAELETYVREIPTAVIQAVATAAAKRR